jgi:hypothetical protein
MRTKMQYTQLNPRALFLLVSHKRIRYGWVRGNLAAAFWHGVPVCHSLRGEARVGRGPDERSFCSCPEQYRLDSTWYLALAHEMVGEVQASLTELRKLCGNKSSYATRACEERRIFQAIIFAWLEVRACFREE